MPLYTRKGGPSLWWSSWLFGKVSTRYSLQDSFARQRRSFCCSFVANSPTAITYRCLFSSPFEQKGFVSENFYERGNLVWKETFHLTIYLWKLIRFHCSTGCYRFESSWWEIGVFRGFSEDDFSLKTFQRLTFSEADKATISFAGTNANRPDTAIRSLYHSIA